MKKSVWLPLCLCIYAVCMTVYFGPKLIEEGLSLKFWITAIAELAVIVALFFALRRKERLADKWKN